MNASLNSRRVAPAPVAPPPFLNHDLSKRMGNEAFWRDVFQNGEPKKEIKPGTRYISLPGWFPTRKNPRGLIRTSSPLTRDLMFHLDTDHEIVSIADFPVTTTYRSKTPTGFKVREHIPELAVLRRDGAVFVVDVMPLNVQPTIPFIRQRTIDLKSAYFDQGATYLLLDETSLHLEPLLGNLKRMWKHKKSDHELPEMEVIRRWILDARFPTTIGELMRESPVNAVFAHWSDQPEDTARHVTENNPVFSAVMQLAIAGLVEVDLDAPFSPSTTVTLKEKSNVRL
ncbi:hypothetical protein LVY75_27090 [Sinorhizobium sp. B11]